MDMFSAVMLTTKVSLGGRFSIWQYVYVLLRRPIFDDVKSQQCCYLVH